MRTVIADFNTIQIDPRKRVMLGEIGTPNGDRLEGCQPGERVLLDGGDLEVVGVLEYDAKFRVWYAVPDWSTRQDTAVESESDVTV